MIAPGQRVGHYLIETRLGAGGMGEVFRAFDESLERPVAIKVLPKAVEGHPEARARMLREARAASALVHANIVTVHEVDEHDGQTILVMELVEGETLSHLLMRQGKRPVGEALRLVRQVGKALAFAHQAGFVHRDIKCSNLMVMRDGHVKVLDFGLSKRTMKNGEAIVDASPDTVGIRKPAMPPEAATDPTAPALPPGMGVEARTVPGKSGADLGRPPSMPTHDSDARARAAAAARRDDLTVEGAAMGTPGYSALELMDGQPADGRADVFSLGVVLYELVTATRPYSGIDWPGVRSQIVAEKYKRPREVVPALPPALDAAIVHALRAERDQRTPSIDAFLAELDDIDVPDDDGPGHRRKRGRRRKTAAIALGAAVFAGGATWAAVRVRSGNDGERRSADATAVVPDQPLDAAAPVDAPPLPPPAAVRVTATKACVYAPAFLDDTTVAFDLTTSTDARDLAVVKLPATAEPGGRPLVPRPIVRPGTYESQAAPGTTPGELIFYRYDRSNRARNAIMARDLASGAEREILAAAADAIAAQGGAYYYVPNGGTSLRRVRDKIDEAVTSLDTAGNPVALVASRDPAKLLISGRVDDAGTLCVFDLTSSMVDCPQEVQEPLAARPDQGRGMSLYYASRGGIRARSPSGDDVMVAPGALASGGLAVSPSGRTLVWSDCGERDVLRDVTVKPAADLSFAEHIVTPVAGPGGRLAWVQHGSEVVVRLRDGTTASLTPPGGPPIKGAPAFDDDGGRMVFARGGDEAGLWTVDIGDPTSLHRVTSDASDEAPLFVASGELLFTRMVDGHPSVFRLRDGGEAMPALTDFRRTVDVDRGSRRVLLRSEDDRYLYWWDPQTRTETQGPPTFAPASDVTRSISLSPDGEYLLYRSGANGGELWRTPESMLQFQRITMPADSVGVSAAAIDDDGHALVVTRAWRGELWRLDAPPDASW